MLVFMSAEPSTVALQEIQIRHLAETPEIIPLLAKWHHDQWGYLPGARTLAQRITRLQDHLQRDAIPATVVAWKDGQPVGSASLVANDMEVLAEWIPWLANVFVLPQYRRQGIGAQLVEGIASATINLGYPRLYLYTLDQAHFYEELGWHISHVRFYRGHDMTVMTRDLIVSPPRKVVEAHSASAPNSV